MLTMGWPSTPTGGVDLLDGEIDAGDLGWSEERQDASLRQQLADRHDAVTLAGAFLTARARGTPLRPRRR